MSTFLSQNRMAMVKVNPVMIEVAVRTAPTAIVFTWSQKITPPGTKARTTSPTSDHLIALQVSGRDLVN